MRALVVVRMMVAALAVRGARLLLWEGIHVFRWIRTCWRVVPAAVPAALVPGRVAITRVLLLLGKSIMIWRGSAGCGRVGSVALIASVSWLSVEVVMASSDTTSRRARCAGLRVGSLLLLLLRRRDALVRVNRGDAAGSGSHCRRNPACRRERQLGGGIVTSERHFFILG